MLSVAAATLLELMQARGRVSLGDARAAGVREVLGAVGELLAVGQPVRSDWSKANGQVWFLSPPIDRCISREYSSEHVYKEHVPDDAALSEMGSKLWALMELGAWMTKREMAAALKTTEAQMRGVLRRFTISRVVKYRVNVRHKAGGHGNTREYQVEKRQ